MTLTNIDKAHLKFAATLGYIDSDDFAHLEQRWARYNEQEHEFGPEYLSLEAYLEMEKTSFMLFYARNNAKAITDEEIIKYYNSNLDLFTRADGDSFELPELVEIIKKRIREEEYLDNVKRILLQYEEQ